MSRWDIGPSQLDRARILVEYTDAFGDDVLAALQYLHDGRLPADRGARAANESDASGRLLRPPKNQPLSRD